MIVVADSSPIVVLVSIGHVELFSNLFGRVIVPPKVVSELASAKRPRAVREFIANPPVWLEMRSPSATENFPGLDEGESAAISLALELRADRLIIDESAGRRVAIERKVKVTGTIGLLIAAAERDLVDLGRVFEQVKETDFWISHKFLDEQLALFQERKIAVQADRPIRETTLDPDAAPNEAKTIKKDRGFERGV